MDDFLPSFARACASVVHPRMLWLTALPFLAAGVGWAAVLGFGWAYFVGLARQALDAGALGAAAFQLFGSAGQAGLRLVVAPLLVAALAIPLIVVSALLLSASLSMPVVLRHLSERRFSSLAARRGGSWYGSFGHALLASGVCLLLMIVTLPLWLVPPLFAVIPPLLWGWLAYRVMTYDALAEHATAAERRELQRRHRWPLLAIGICTGLLGSLPGVAWASSALLIVLFPVVAVGAVWVYVFIFVFSALWFAHYCLRALEELRAEAPDGAPPAWR